MSLTNINHLRLSNQRPKGNSIQSESVNQQTRVKPISHIRHKETSPKGQSQTDLSIKFLARGKLQMMKDKLIQIIGYFGKQQH